MSDVRASMTAASRSWTTSGLGVLCVLAALLHHPAVEAARSKAVALLLLGVLMLGWRAAETRGALRVPLALAAWLGLCGWLTLSLAWSPTRDATLLATLAAMATLAWSLAQLPRQQRRRLAKMVASGVGGGSGAWAVAQAYAGAGGIALHGGHGNPNWLGLVIACGLPLQVSQVRHSNGRSRQLGCAALALALAGLLLSGSRTAWLALAVATLLALPWRRALPLAIGTAGALWWLPQEAWRSLAGRSALAGVGSHAAISALPFGAGAGGFRHAFLDAQATVLAPLPIEQAALRFSSATSAHNDWLELAVVGGPIALLAFAAALAVAWIALRTRWPAASSAVAVLAVCCAGDHALGQPAALLPLAFALSDTPSPTPVRHARAAALALTAAAALLLADGAERWWLRHELTSAERLPAPEAHALRQRLAATYPHSSSARVALGHSWLTLGAPGAALTELEAGKRADVSLRVARGSAARRAGKLTQATAHFRAALVLHPGSFAARLNLAESLLQSGAHDAAGRELALARSLQPHHPKLRRLAERLRRARIDRAVAPAPLPPHRG